MINYVVAVGAIQQRTSEEIRRINMNFLKVFALSLILAGAVFLPAARADDRNEKTKIVFTQPVGIPGAVLPAGTYWFILEPYADNRDVVQIFNGDWSTLCATLITVPTDHAQPPDKTEIEFAVRPGQEAEALVTWYYPGRATGHEFLYPKREERELASDVKRDVFAQPINRASNAAGPHALVVVSETAQTT
jgi:hypothetical protein